MVALDILSDGFFAAVAGISFGTCPESSEAMPEYRVPSLGNRPFFPAIDYQNLAFSLTRH